MARNLVQKLLDSHVVSGEASLGHEIGIRVDQTLTQDATGTMAYLQFEAMGIPRVQVDLAVSYVDHNTLQSGHENMDDHCYLRDVAAKIGAYFSQPGNGICHQCHLERFAAPGKTLLGSDSHTPTAGGIGALAIGAGGLDVAVAMGGGPFYVQMPEVVNVRLTGKLRPWVSSKDVILDLLRRLSVKGGVGKVLEYSGPGVKTLSVPERATITNMGAELGATTSIFPSDDVTRSYLKAQARARDWARLEADADAAYDDQIGIDLSTVVPLVAMPDSPDRVRPAEELTQVEVGQVCIGSCTNSSYVDLMTAARVLKGKRIASTVGLTVSPGSRQVLRMVAQDGGLDAMLAAGARLLEVACGPCIGMGQAPGDGMNTLRTFNRNFAGRSGTKTAGIYLCSPAVAAASALTGRITDPRTLGRAPRIKAPERFSIDDSMVIPPAKSPAHDDVRRGPNIKPVPIKKKLPSSTKAEVLLKVDDNITTDHILPGGSRVLPLRSNIPAISEFTFSGIDSTFAERALRAKKGLVVAGENYGQGSSREHAALAPMHLGVQAVIAKSFARIHRANLVNFGIIPLTFDDPDDYEGTDQGDCFSFQQLRKCVSGDVPLRVRNETKGREVLVSHGLTERQKEILLAGGLLNYTRERASSGSSSG